MWIFLTEQILRHRTRNLIILSLLTIFMGYFLTKNKISNEMMQMLPETDSTFIEYQNFKKQFGQDGALVFMAFEDDHLFELERFQSLQEFTNDIRNTEGIEECLSVARTVQLVKNDSLKKFDVKILFPDDIASQTVLDSLHQELEKIDLYKGLLYNDTSHVYLLMITLQKDIVNSPKRSPLIYQLKEMGQAYGEKMGVEVHFSGMPLIRTETTELLKGEMGIYMLLAILVAIALLTLFFRSFNSTFYPIVIVLISLIWTFGIIGLLGYQLTMLTVVVPTMIIIMGIENCIFLINKYHTEYREHGNKAKALTRVIHHIGSANFLTNATTAVAFASFIVTGNKQLVEFGVVASISIMANYLLTLILLPTILSYLKPLSSKNLDHLNAKPINKFLSFIMASVQNYRGWVYGTLAVLLVIAGFGVSQLKTTGNVVDDVPRDGTVYQDLLFLEKNFKGVLPFEITVNTQTKRGVMQIKNMQKIDSLQMLLEEYPQLSKSLSLVNVIKYGNQVFYGNDPAYYEVPSKRDLAFLQKYIPSFKREAGKKTLIDNFIDSSFQTIRVTAQLQDIGTTEINVLFKDLLPKIHQLFPEDQYKVSITGTAVTFLEGTNYLKGNLIQSIGLAIITIALLMSLLFSSFRMILISMVPNLFPLIMTAGIMGYFGVAIKPATIIIFGISLGISVNDAIHFLSRYRLQLKLNNGEIQTSVIKALRETGHSMIYSVMILFFGFGVFAFSSFGSIQVLGFLVPVTLGVALFCNLFFMPSLLLTTRKKGTTDNFVHPSVQILDPEPLPEEEMKELKDLEEKVDLSDIKD
ncbi:MAG: MMPL family transporter [Bacteroidales bacterium]|nr:MMPL family transporter [Bacteroidales bacterium]